jgi:hypothetical protein
VEVAQRDDEEKAGGIADLAGRDDRRSRSRPGAEVARDLVQDRLGVVQVGDDGTGRDGDEGDQGARQGVRSLE